MVYKVQKEFLLAVIGDEDTVVGFLLGGIGDESIGREANYFIVQNTTTSLEIEKAFKSFAERDDIAIILINQNVANTIRGVIDNYKKSIPTVLEIPSKETPYDISKDSFLNRARQYFHIEEFM
uniref:V-type proton ATPase subunit F n=1 Tax=Strongyloides stercoralis TaxID=6248 RepID=A0A0K0DZN3_STRER